MSEWKLSIKAEPIIPAWMAEGNSSTLGVELQRTILRGFSEHKENPESFTFEKVFTFKEHGEFFRGALTMASLRYAGDFYELLQRYGTIKVTISKYPNGDQQP